MLNKLKYVLFGILMLFCFTACSNTKIDSGTNTSNESGTNSNDSGIKNDNTIGSYLNSKETILYEYGYADEYIEDVGKDTVVQFIIVFKDQKATIYRVFELQKTLGQLSKMSESEIKEKLAEWDKSSKEKYVADKKASLKGSKDSFKQLELEKLNIKEHENEYYNPVVTDYKFIVETDPSGNYTKEEIIAFDKWVIYLSLDTTDDKNIYTTEHGDYTNFESLSPIKIFDTSYIISTYHGKSKFAIRFNEKFNLYVDTPKSNLNNIEIK